VRDAATRPRRPAPHLTPDNGAVSFRRDKPAQDDALLAEARESRWHGGRAFAKIANNPLLRGERRLKIKDAILCFGDSQEVCCGDPYSSKDISLISEWRAGDEAAVPWRELCPPWREETEVETKTSMATVPPLHLALSRRPPESRSRKTLRP
jgi:hypothetical protein